MVCKQVIIKGRVQGVFFRVRTRDKAEELGIKGEVRNLADGSVEVIACGKEAKVEQLIAWCRQGPPKAKVQEVLVRIVDASGFETFNVVRG